MRWVAALAVTAALCVACADAFSPHRAMKARGPVSPFPIEPAAAAADAGAHSPMPAVAAGSPAAAAAALKAQADVPAHDAALAVLRKYWTAWSSAAGAKFSAAPAMQLYMHVPHVHELLTRFPALHAVWKGEYEKLHDVKYERVQAVYERELLELFKHITSFAYTEDAPGARKVEVVSPHMVKVTTSYRAAVELAGGKTEPAFTGPLELLIERDGDAWKIRSEVFPKAAAADKAQAMAKLRAKKQAQAAAAKPAAPKPHGA